MISVCVVEKGPRTDVDGLDSEIFNRALQAIPRPSKTYYLRIRRYILRKFLLHSLHVSAVSVLGRRSVVTQWPRGCSKSVMEPRGQHEDYFLMFLEFSFSTPQPISPDCQPASCVHHYFILGGVTAFLHGPSK
jgi:hypothetical protein